jgi:hypothetical protein
MDVWGQELLKYLSMDISDNDENEIVIHNLLPQFGVSVIEKWMQHGGSNRLS